MTIRKETIYIILYVLLFSFVCLSSPGEIRYHIEKIFGGTNTFFYVCELGIKSEKNNYYEDKFDLLYTEPPFNINITKYKNSKLYLYGKFANSADPLTISLNGNILQEISLHDASFEKHFWEEYYLEKYFVVELPYKIGINELILITGNRLERFFIYLE